MKQKNITCPNCRKEIAINFDNGDLMTGSKDHICPHCNGHICSFVESGKSIFFPNALDQYGQPRVLRTPAPL
jgi:hypothetical protein